MACNAAESFGRVFFCNLGKKWVFIPFLPILCHFSSNPINFQEKSVIIFVTQIFPHFFYISFYKFYYIKINKKSKKNDKKKVLKKSLENFQNNYKNPKYQNYFKHAKKKCWKRSCPMSFAISGDYSLTKALQSTPFHNPGGVP